MVDQFTGADSGFSVRSSSGNNGVEVKPCRLHLMSPTFRSVKDFTGKLAGQFSHEVGREIREVVETFQGNVHFLPMENCEQQYVDQYSMGLIAREFTYRFPFGISAAGFLSFDSLLPRCFTEVCFGGHISKTDGPAALSKIDRYLMGKVASRLIRAWLQKWKVVFEDDHRDEVGVEWLGDCPSNTGLMEESCLRLSFEIGFELEGINDDNHQDASLKFPIHFFLPLLPLEHAMISSRLSSEPSMDLQCSSNISVLLNSTVNITAEMMKLSLPITKAKALKAGDIIPVEPLGDARVLIEGVPFGKAEVVQQSGNLVLKVNDITFSGVAND